MVDPKPCVTPNPAEIRSIGGEVSWCAADLSKVREVKRLVRPIIRAYGAIHILVNNASILGPREPIVRYPLRSVVRGFTWSTTSTKGGLPSA